MESQEKYQEENLKHIVIIGDPEIGLSDEIIAILKQKGLKATVISLEQAETIERTFLIEKTMQTKIVEIRNYDYNKVMPMPSKKVQKNLDKQQIKKGWKK